jgi:hypothetical protein
MGIGSTDVRRITNALYMPFFTEPEQELSPEIHHRTETTTLCLNGKETAAPCCRDVIGGRPCVAQKRSQ